MRGKGYRRAQCCSQDFSLTEQVKTSWGSGGGGGGCKPPSEVRGGASKFLKLMIFNTTEGQFLERQASK